MLNTVLSGHAVCVFVFCTTFSGELKTNSPTFPSQGVQLSLKKTPDLTDDGPSVFCLSLSQERVQLPSAVAAADFVCSSFLAQQILFISVQS